MKNEGEVNVGQRHINWCHSFGLHHPVCIHWDAKIGKAFGADPRHMAKYLPSNSESVS